MKKSAEHIDTLQENHIILMTKKQFEAVVLKEECEYKLTEDFAESFKGIDIDVGPRTDDEGVNSTAGVVDDCYYSEGKGIVVEFTIFNGEIEKKLESGSVSLCPTVSKDLSNPDDVVGIDLFFTRYPGEVVGKVTKV